MSGKKGPEVGVTLTLDDQMSSKLSIAEQQLQATAQKMQRVGQQARMSGMMMAGAGVVGLMASNKLMKGAAATEQSYAKVNTMLDEGEDAMADYGGSVKQLTKEIAVQGGEIGANAALYQVLSAGVAHGADAINVLEVSMKAAVGGMTDTETAVDAITTALNAYQFEASDATRVADVLAQSVKLGKISFSELSQNIGPVLAIAAQLKIPIEEVGALFATLTANGINAAEAGTSLNATMMMMLQPSEALKAKLAELGYESGSAMVKQNGLVESIAMLAEATDGTTEAMTELFPNTRAVKMVLPLAGQAAEQVADTSMR